MISTITFHDIESVDKSIEEFNTNGIAFFKKILPDEVLLEAEKKIEEQIKEDVETESLVNLHLTQQWFANFVSRKEFVNIAASLLGIKKVKVFSSMILNKPPRGLMAVPWHQDAAYDWPLDPVDCASLWLALDDVNIENGSMKVALGAHKESFSMEETPKPKRDDKFFSTQLQQSIPESLLQNYKKIYITMPKGCASFHHSMLPHCSTQNVSDRRRCAFIVRYCRGDAKLLKYPGMKREEYFKDFVLFDPYT